MVEIGFLSPAEVVNDALSGTGHDIPRGTGAISAPVFFTRQGRKLSPEDHTSWSHLCSSETPRAEQV